MNFFANLAHGFSLLFQPQNILATFLGQLIGVMVGILPGINASMAVSILLPLSFGLSPETALMLLAGIYMGTMYGGSITSILLRVPGTSTAAVICLDGYELTRQGRAGLALGITAIGSFIAGTFSLIVLMTLAPTLARAALAFGPPEYFALIFFGLLAIAGLEEGVVRGLIAGCLGLLLGTIGVDPVTGVARFTFGRIELLDGIDFIAVLIGLFAISQAIMNLERIRSLELYRGRLTGMLPRWREFKEALGSILRGSVLGTIVGILPGVGATTATFLSYSLEARLAKDKSQVGKGDLRCVAGPGSADNAAAGGAFVPMLSLGIPGSETTAVLLGVLMIHGIQPGPLLFTKQTGLVWGLIASLWVANFLGLVLATAGVRPLTQILRLPMPVMSAFILVTGFVGAYALNNNIVDVWIALFFGVAGYIMRRVNLPIAPLILGLVLGPLAEKSFRQSMALSRGDPSIFFTRPISAAVLGLGLATVILPFLWTLAKRAWRKGARS
ncbi:MAG: tripartite tricarboxylate transporter permease [Candidatus Bipolaricaulaceae bacterium]